MAEDVTKALALIDAVRRAAMAEEEVTNTLDELIDDFPQNWDLQLFVCCRGDTLNGPEGIRRWTATAVPATAIIVAQARAGKISGWDRVSSSCCDTPKQAVLEVIKIIGNTETVEAG